MAWIGKPVFEGSWWMLSIFGGAQGEQPGGVGVWQVQFVLLFLGSSSKDHKAASAGGSNTGDIHSWGGENCPLYSSSVKIQLCLFLSC